MLVRHDIYRANRAALPASHARAEQEPWQMPRQRAEPDVDAMPIALAGGALDGARDVAVGQPFTWATEWSSVVRVSSLRGHCG